MRINNGDSKAVQRDRDLFLSHFSAFVRPFYFQVVLKSRGARLLSAFALRNEFKRTERR